MPQGRDGRLDPDVCAKWYEKHVFRQGMKPGPRPKEEPEPKQPRKTEPSRRSAAAPSASDGHPNEPSVDRSFGVAWACRLLCSNIREYLPAVLAEITLCDPEAPTVALDSGRELPDEWATKLGVVVLIDYLLTGWCEEVLSDLDEYGLKPLPEINLGGFGEHAEAAAELCEYMRDKWEWKSAGEGNDV